LYGRTHQVIVIDQNTVGAAGVISRLDLGEQYESNGTGKK